MAESRKEIPAQTADKRRGVLVLSFVEQEGIAVTAATRDPFRREPGSRLDDVLSQRVRTVIDSERAVALARNDISGVTVKEAAGYSETYKGY